MASIINLSTAGVQLAYAVEATAGTRPSTGFTRIHGIKSTPSLNPAPETIEATTLDETEYKTYVNGLHKLLMSLVCLFALVALVACGQTNNNNTGNGENNGGETTPTEATYKLGMGIVVSQASSTNAKTAQVDATVATVVLDKDGKIVLCRLDAVQNKIAVDATGKVTVPETFKTKRELGYDYNMKAYGTSLIGNETVKEWFEQAEAFENHVKGMTVADVEAMGTQDVLNAKGETYVISNDQTLLGAGCTMQISGIKAVVAQSVEYAR